MLGGNPQHSLVAGSRRSADVTFLSGVDGPAAEPLTLSTRPSETGVDEVRARLVMDADKFPMAISAIITDALGVHSFTSDLRYWWDRRNAAALLSENHPARHQ